MTLGAQYLQDRRCKFRVWAPRHRVLHLHLFGPRERLIPMQPCAWGYHEVVIEDVPGGALYKFRLSGTIERPDPASQFQPHGIHEASAVVDPHFTWSDSHWRGLELCDYIFYELHVGTFTQQGTFAAVVEHLDYLVDLGITAVELMPVAQFPGGRNWGYDGVHPFAVQNTYGPPADLKQLINACHERGLAVVLDVVYNHLGPEGNYFNDFGPYFSDRDRIRWGQALNFDGRDCDPVRNFFIDNALFWITEFHIDALRMDAVHAIHDNSATHLLAEIAAAVQKQAVHLNRRIHLFPESGQNDPRLTERREIGGYGLDAEWNEDFHRSLHALLTSEQNGYYGDYGTITQLAKAYSHGFVFDGQYVKYRGRRYGRSSYHVPAERFIVFSQNHDQTGNRLAGERLSHLVDFETQKLAAAAVLLSPFLPLLFMGEEYGETAPFLYFISHMDPQLVEAVRTGRMQDFAGFHWGNGMFDPQAVDTFERCRLDHSLRVANPQALLHRYYRSLIRLRKSVSSLKNLSKADMAVRVVDRESALILHRSAPADEAIIILNFNELNIFVDLPQRDSYWQLQLDSSDTIWGGPGTSRITEQSEIAEVARRSACVLVRQLQL